MANETQGIDSKDYQGRHVVVTGGTGALGSAVVDALLARGAEVHVPVYAEAELARFAPARPVRTAIGVDLSDEASCAAFYADVNGPLWASIHIAGGFSMAPIEETSVSDYQKLVALNLTTCFLSCREAARAMGDAGGRIVNVSAQPALVPTGGLAVYSATKSAVAGLTLSLSEELAPRGIWVNAIVPSTMRTDANVAGMPDADHDAWPTTAEVASTIAFLASPGNAVTRGALIPVYGRT